MAKSWQTKIPVQDAEELSLKKLFAVKHNIEILPQYFAISFPVVHNIVFVSVHWFFVREWMKRTDGSFGVIPQYIFLQFKVRFFQLFSHPICMDEEIYVAKIAVQNDKQHMMRRQYILQMKGQWDSIDF